MSKPTLTPEIIAAASLDAGNRSASKHGRAAWSIDDYNAACEESHRLWRIIDSHSNRPPAMNHDVPTWHGKPIPPTDPNSEALDGPADPPVSLEDQLRAAIDRAKRADAAIGRAKTPAIRAAAVAVALKAWQKAEKLKEALIRSTKMSMTPCLPAITKH